MKITFEIIREAFKLPVDKIKDFFTKKGVELSNDYEYTADLIRKQSWSVSGVTKMRIIQDTKKSLQKAINEGQNIKNWIKGLPDYYKQNGWLPNKDTKGFGKVGTIYQTNVQSAYNDGRYSRQIETIKTLPYYQYVAIIDSQTTLGCRTLNGKVFRKDDLDFASDFRPPRHYNCRSILRSIPTSVAKKIGITESNEVNAYKADKEFQGKNGIFSFEPKQKDYQKELFQEYKKEYEKETK